MSTDAGQRLIDDLRGKAIAMLCAYTGRCVADLSEEEIHRMSCSLDAVLGPEIERLRGVEARYEWLKASSPGGCWWSEYAPSEKDFDAMVDYGIAASRSTGAADVGEEK